MTAVGVERGRTVDVDFRVTAGAIGLPNRLVPQVDTSPPTARPVACQRREILDRTAGAKSTTGLSGEYRETGPVRRREAQLIGGVTNPAAARQQNDGSAELTPVRAVTRRLPSGPAHARRPTDHHLALHVSVRPALITQAPRRPPLHFRRIHISNISSTRSMCTHTAQRAPWLDLQDTGGRRTTRPMPANQAVPTCWNGCPHLPLKKWGQPNMIADLRKQRSSWVICPHFYYSPLTWSYAATRRATRRRVPTVPTFSEVRCPLGKAKDVWSCRTARRHDNLDRWNSRRPPRPRWRRPSRPSCSAASTAGWRTAWP